MSEASANEKTSLPPTVVGKVVSNKMEKTIVVQFERKIKHPRYGKYVVRKTKLFAHDETGQTKEGDIVVIRQCRPLSKKKQWQLIEVLERSTEVN